MLGPIGVRDISLCDVVGLLAGAVSGAGYGNGGMKNDEHLRDTCVMPLDRAGNDPLSICDITDHSYQSTQLIMKSYRARSADAAIEKLVAFVSKERPA